MSVVKELVTVVFTVSLMPVYNKVNFFLKKHNLLKTNAKIPSFQSLRAPLVLSAFLLDGLLCFGFFVAPDSPVMVKVVLFVVAQV